jgi:hypothetical protein
MCFVLLFYEARPYRQLSTLFCGSLTNLSSDMAILSCFSFGKETVWSNSLMSNLGIGFLRVFTSSTSRPESGICRGF